MSLFQLFGSFELGMIFAIVAFGVWISFRVLDFPDLTVDGSFPLGAGVAATLIVAGYDPWLATLAAAGAGALAGLLTAWLNVRWGILHLLASILTMTALYSINLRIMGRPNVALLSEQTLLTPYEALFEDRTVAVLGVLGLLCAVIAALLWWFFQTERGLALRATGANPRMARAQGVRPGAMIMQGLALSNALVALAGALFAQTQGFADVSMGLGTIVVGLAAVIIGEVILHPKRIAFALIGCLIGSIVYRMAVAFALNAGSLGLQASDLNLITALLVGLAMVLPRLKATARRKLKQQRRPS
ncbi:MAG: ABC transporter permease [Holosporales bacterium]